MNQSMADQSRRHPWRKALISILILAAGAGAVAVVAVLPGRQSNEQPKKVPPVNVKVIELTPRAEVAETFVLYGLVEPSCVVDVSAEVNGGIEKIHTRQGRTCEEKDLLIELNKDLLSARWRRDRATTEFDKREHERLVALKKRGVATATEVDQAAAKAKASQAALDLAQANLDRAEIVAPISGVLDSIPVEAGEYITAGTCVAKIVQIDTVKIVLDVPERIIRHLRLGDPHTVVLDPRTRAEASANITYISELADQKIHTTRVELTADNPRRERDGGPEARDFRSGQIVSVRLTLRKHPGAIMIPLRAVIPLEEGKVVYVVEDGKAVRRKVKLGFYAGKDDVHVQITEGLKAGDQLIVEGQGESVAPGQKVRVVTGE